MSARSARSTWSISAPLASVPERYRGRKLYVHNPQVTLMRTTAAENARSAAGSASGSTAWTGRCGSSSRARRLRARCARPAVLRPGSRRGVVPHPRTDRAPDRQPSDHPRQAPHQRSRIRRRHRRRVPRVDRTRRARAEGPRGSDARFARQKSGKVPRDGRARRTDRRRRRGHGPFRQMRGSGRRRSHRDLQFRAATGWPAAARSPDCCLWRRQRDRGRNGRRGAACRQAHAGAGGSERNRSVSPDGRLLRRD